MRDHLQPGRVFGAFAVAVALSAAAAASGALPAAERLGKVRRELERRTAILRDDQAALIASRMPTDGSPVLRQRPRLMLKPGELVSATERKFSAVRVILEEPESRAKLMPLDEQFVPRGVDYDADRKLLAIAAVSRVLLFDTVASVTTVLQSPLVELDSFGFANDVMFDGAGKLLIADQGETTGARVPADGSIWEYDLETGDFTQLAIRQPLANPKLLAQDPSGTIYFVEGAGGPLITPAFEFRYDAVMFLVGKKRQGARRFYTGPGVQATGFDIAPDGRFWFANVAEIALLQDDVLSLPCALPLPFRFLTGLAIASETAGYVLDGTDLQPGKGALYGVTVACAATLELEGNKLNQARGLALVSEPTP